MKILLSGVGGQGILFITRVLAELALARGWSVVGAETHGMAQRGGSVVSHLKINQYPAAPLIRRGSADLLFGLEENEGLRFLGHLRPGGHLLLNLGPGKFKRPLIQAYLKEAEIVAKALPAGRLALEMGYPLGTNIILLGAAEVLKWLPFTRDEIEEVIDKLSRPDLVQPNLDSFRCGRRQDPWLE
jgi:indolepyruvate ferredoxin oxidoreductase beta subunit